MADHFTIFGDKRGEELLLSDASLMAQAQGLREMPDGPVAVEFRRERKGVSALQRGYWFAVVVKRIAEHTGDDTDSTHEDVKRELFPKLGLPLSIRRRRGVRRPAAFAVPDEAVVDHRPEHETDDRT